MVSHQSLLVREAERREVKMVIVRSTVRRRGEGLHVVGVVVIIDMVMTGGV